jgi:cell division protein FtsZ
MIQFDLPKEQSSIIKVIGVGGGGSNAVNYMHSLDIDGVDFMVCNTDAQALSQSKVPNKIQLGPSLTQGLGAGANPEIGRQATEESLDEIRRILEVNTKMAFVTAGMGGGTGTGGAPIIAKICRDMGILTVGIITTPFSYEGKKRALHAEAGIQQMKSVVDTLLVISNDKLRHQFGNLTMSAALSTADNVLATAAKCITDVINTKGQINVDFADVCTVMRNGGVAILGSARASGEHRAQLVIEQALNSPLLNDNDISGAKWVLININSRSGESEFTMDEVETIQEYLLTQAGPEADIILGLGYDESLGDDISITIIATGFEGKSALGNSPAEKQQEKKDEKVMFMLDVNPQPVKKVELVEKVEEVEAVEAVEMRVEEVEAVEVVEMRVEEVEAVEVVEMRVEEVEVVEGIVEEVEMLDDQPIVFELDLGIESVEGGLERFTEVEGSLVESNSSPSSPVPSPLPSSGFLQKPTQIYATEVQAEQPLEVAPTAQEPSTASTASTPSTPSTPSIPTPEETTFELVYHEPAQEVVQDVQEKITPEPMMEEPVAFDEAEVQKNKAAERLYKLRNLSYNFNAADPNNEYENIPAYVRHNLRVHNTTLASVEKFYSNYSVGLDENNITQINTINTFLEGKKPD